MNIKSTAPFSQYFRRFSAKILKNQFFIPLKYSLPLTIWPGDGEVDPGFYSELELDYPKCKHNKKYPESSLCAYHGTPKAGPGRTCGISGIADTHEYHLEFIVKKCIERRGFTEIIDDDPFVDPFPEHPLGYFIVQMDKNTYILKGREPMPTQ